MKMKISVLLLVILAAMSCRKDNDETPPTITSVQLTGNFTNLDSIPVGDTIHLKVEVTDDIALGQLKADFHQAFDAHTGRSVAFDYTLIEDLSGKSYTYEKDIYIDSATLSGPYHLSVDLADHHGNTGLYNRTDFQLLNTSAPVIHLTGPAFTPQPTFATGDTIPLTGTITDNTDLATVRILLRTTSYYTTLYDQTFTLSGTSDTSWDFSAISAAGLPVEINSNASGKCELIILAEDLDGNYRQWKSYLTAQ